MGLYGERIGFLGGVVNDKNVVPNIMTQLSLIIRPMYSNPAGQGAKIVGKDGLDPHTHLVSFLGVLVHV